MTANSQPPEPTVPAKKDEARVWDEIRKFYAGLSPERRRQLHLSEPEYERASAEAAERARRNRPKYRLTRQAKKALGKVSPELAWLQVGTMVAHVQEQYEEAGEELCRINDLGEDLWNLLEWLGNMDPVKGLNLLNNQVPDLNLRGIPHQAPLSVLEAVLKMAVNRAGLSESDCRRLFRKS